MSLKFNAIIDFCQTLCKLRKEISQSVCAQKTLLDHVWNWKETPQQEILTAARYDEIMLNAGVEAEKLQDKAAGVKGQLSARLARQKR